MHAEHLQMASWQQMRGEVHYISTVIGTLFGLMTILFSVPHNCPLSSPPLWHVSSLVFRLLDLDQTAVRP